MVPTSLDLFPGNTFVVIPVEPDTPVYPCGLKSRNAVWKNEISLRERHVPSSRVIPSLSFRTDAYEKTRVGSRHAMRRNGERGNDACRELRNAVQPKKRKTAGTCTNVVRQWITRQSCRLTNCT